MRTLLLSVVLVCAPCFAEAGLPYSFCSVSSCACGANTCSCGEVCNLNTQMCGSSQMGFCSNDSNCAATCDAFICEGNVCVKGVRDGGSSVPGVDGGSNNGGNGGGGCSTAAGPFALALLAAALRLGRRKLS